MQLKVRPILAPAALWMLSTVAGAACGMLLPAIQGFVLLKHG